MAQIGQVTNVHDPCIIKCDEYYYVFSTGDRIAIRRSRNLASWQFIGEVFDDIPTWGKQEVPGVSNIWAPDIFYQDSTYYLFYSLSTFGSNRSRIGLVTNKTLNPQNPEYKWIDRGKVFESNPNSDNYNAIDANIIMDQEENVWMTFGSFWSGIKLVELDKTAGKPPANWQLRSIAGRGGGAIEAPFIVYKHAYYYLFVSFDLCCRGVNSTYKIMVGRAQKIIGPYFDKNNRAMINGGGHLLLEGDDRWHGPGHCAVLLEQDKDWLVYHAYDARSNGVPTLRITRLYWDNEGWPVVDNPSAVQKKTSSLSPGFTLYQNYPNPFNSSSNIDFYLNKDGHVKLTIYNANGQEIVTLINDSLPQGQNTVSANTAILPSGLLFYVLEMDALKKVKKMIVLN